MAINELKISKKKTVYLREERDRAVFDAYNNAIKNHIFKTQEDAFDYVRTHPAPRFFIEPEFCTTVICRMLRGEPMGIKGEHQRRKFNELFRRYKGYLSAHPGCSSIVVCSVIVNESAPEFYISNRSIRFIISKQREDKCREMQRRYKL